MGKYFVEKSPIMPKKTELGILWSRTVLYVTRKKRETYLFHFSRPNALI